MKYSLTNIPLYIALFLSTPLLLTADDKETIGLNDLLIREPGLDGSGLRVAMVEAIQASNVTPPLERYQPNPAEASQPASKFSFFDTGNPYPISGTYQSSKRSNHANSVANSFFDLNTGVATDVSEIFVFNAAIFYNSIIAPNVNIDSKVINQSFITGSQSASADSDYDDYADQHQTLFVNGLGNGRNSAITTPASAFNCISVGRESLIHSRGPDDGRSKPEIIAPSPFTSFSTPYVAGSAAVLIEAALPPLEHGGANTAATASDIRTIKALVLNGAVKDSSWSNTETKPLDTLRGAGMLNVNHSHLQLQGGKHSPTLSEDYPPADTHTPPSNQAGNIASNIGWNFTTITNPLSGFFSPGRDRVDNYYFNLPAGDSTLYDLTTTLVWHRQANRTTINNLDLILYDADTGTVVEQSISPVDNLEHIHIRDIPAGRYVIQVIKRNAGRVTSSEDYALAYNFSIPAPDAPSALTATTQPYREIDLTWTDNSTDEVNFELQRSTISNRAFATIATLPADTTSYTDTAPLPDTTYYYRVKATNANGDSFYTNVSSATTFTPLVSWRQDNFSTTTSTGNAANTADPDQDGINNLTEYALGTDPNSAAGSNGGSAIPKASIISDGNSDYLQITVIRTDNKTDLNYTIEVSGNLEPGWTETTEILQDSPTTLRVRDTVPVSDNSKRFIRLRVTEK